MAVQVTDLQRKCVWCGQRASMWPLGANDLPLCPQCGEEQPTYARRRRLVVGGHPPPRPRPPAPAPDRIEVGSYQAPPWLWALHDLLWWAVGVTALVHEVVFTNDQRPAVVVLALLCMGVPVARLSGGLAALLALLADPAPRCEECGGRHQQHRAKCTQADPCGEGYLLAAYREQYARGDVTLAQYEAMVASLLGRQPPEVDLLPPSPAAPTPPPTRNTGKTIRA